MKQLIICITKIKIFKRKTVVDNYSKGETYLLFKTAIGFQENWRYRTVSLRYLDHNNENGIIVKFNIYITLYIYPCQILSKHGTQVALNPRFSGGSENKIIWQKPSILIQVERLCHLFDNAFKNDQYWFGWILVYLTRCCFSSHKKQEIKDLSR